MRKVCGVFLAFFTLVAICVDGLCALIDSDKYAGVWRVSQNTVVMAGVTRDVDDIFIERSVFLDNNGFIYGDMHVCDGCNLFIKNSGELYGDFYLGESASVTQIVVSKDDLKPLGISGGFNLVVANVRDVNLDDVGNVADGADRVVLQNASLVIGSDDTTTLARSGAPEFELRGIVTLRILDPYAYNGRAVMSNVSGDGTVVFDVDGMGPLYTPHGFMNNGDLYFEIIRETDYLKILGTPVGGFLNLLRDINPADRLLEALDSATTMDEIRRIMRGCIRLNPVKLLWPIDVFNTMVRMGGGLDIGDGRGADLYAVPEYLTADEFVIYASRVGVGVNVSDEFRFSLEGVAGTLNVIDDFDDYSAEFYGANLYLGLNGDWVFARGRAGITVADFETGPMFDGYNIVESPIGRALYAEMDFGGHIYFGEKFVIDPFVGIVGRRDSVGRCRRENVLPHAGVDVTFDYMTGDVRYDYGIGAVVDAHGTAWFDVRVGFESVEDSLRGGIVVGMFHDDNTTALRISFETKYRF